MSRSLRRRPAIVRPPFTLLLFHRQRRAGGAELLDPYRRAASYVDRVLKGEIGFIRVGRVFYLERSEVSRWLEAHRERHVA